MQRETRPEERAPRRWNFDAYERDHEETIDNYYERPVEMADDHEVEHAWDGPILEASR